MSFQFKLPDIGEGVVEGEIVAWKVGVGDPVREDQPLVEVMTDKATVEIPSPRAGVVKALHGGVGAVVAVGSVIVELDSGNGVAEAEPAKGAKREAAKAAAKSGRAEPTSESTLRLPPSELPDAEAGTGNGNGAGVAAAAPAVAAPAAHAPPPRRGGKVLATPATRRLAREAGVDLAQLAGTGPQGRVTRADVVAFREGRRPPLAGLATGLAGAAGPATGGGTGLPFTHSPVPPGTGPEERVKLRALRKRIADQMVRSSLTIPHFSYVDEVDMTDLVALRRRVNEGLAARGQEKLSYLPFIMKACQVAFGEFPEVNALFDNTSDEVVYKKYFNCGLATDTPNGLYVSVIRDVPGRTIAQLGRDIREVTARVRAGKGGREDLTDSTFTITSIGNIGGLFATPIINYPEVAILGVNKIVERPVVRDGQVVVRHMTHLSPSFDHRVVDGALGARFVTRLKGLLENPGLLMADL
jgi:pyruvate dehydrogenase E2 component (dihydrolipoamide acetyltransferase)